MQVEDQVKQQLGLERVEVSLGLSACCLVGAVTAYFQTPSQFRKIAQAIAGCWLASGYAGASLMFYNRYREDWAYDLGFMTSVGLMTVPQMLSLGEMPAISSQAGPFMLGIAAAAYYFDNCSLNLSSKPRDRLSGR
eukprot:TRINITY_DN14394_c0_g1_i1.p3 TRINITY_DN14394_c0_g1~~TRINITY_DN14394_c0_g1_i1.p3  ORF type:complete len:136 (-),score=15.37 TRINITY_DN14394_c0_g1_i1:21-428(-)